MSGRATNRCLINHVFPPIIHVIDDKCVCIDAESEIIVDWLDLWYYKLVRIKSSLLVNTRYFVFYMYRRIDGGNFVKFLFTYIKID